MPSATYFLNDPKAINIYVLFARQKDRRISASRRLDQKVYFLCYFCLDTKVTKKSRPNRNLPEWIQKFRKKIFFCGISSSTLIGKFQNGRIKNNFSLRPSRRREKLSYFANTRSRRSFVALIPAYSSSLLPSYSIPT